MKFMTMEEFTKTKLKDSMIKKKLRKELKARESVLLYISRLGLFLRKLRSRWSGPYNVILITPFGAVTLKVKSRNEFKVNGQRLKHHMGGAMNEE